MTAGGPASPASAGARPSPRRASRRGPRLVSTLLAVVGVAILVTLGVWQLQRLAWKTQLIRRVAALQAAPAEPLSVVLHRVRDGGELDFVRVVTPCNGLADASVPLYGVREGGPGWRMVAACRLPAGGAYASILTDLGYAVEPPGAGPVEEPAPGVAGPVTVTGVLRRPEPQSWVAGLVDVPNGSRGLDGEFFRRDIPAMSRVLRAGRAAPVMLELESPRAGPKIEPAPLPADIPNNHLGYAVTWFGLAAALVAVWSGAWIAARRRA